MELFLCFIVDLSRRGVEPRRGGREGGGFAGFRGEGSEKMLLLKEKNGEGGGGIFEQKSPYSGGTRVGDGFRGEKLQAR